MNYEIIRSIGWITNTIRSEANNIFNKYDLAKSQFIYVIRVVENPGISLQTLANEMGIDRTTSFRAINKLINKGYLVKDSAPYNQRDKILFPTKKAEDIYPTLNKYEEKSSKKLLNNLTDSEISELKRLLNKVKNNYES